MTPVASWSSNSWRGGLRKDGTRKRAPCVAVATCGVASKRSSEDRSKTFEGIAKAMAQQWGCSEKGLGTQTRVDSFFTAK